jgi:alpha-1,2-mannosyltransferase
VSPPLAIFRRASLGLVSSMMLIGMLLWVRWSTFRGGSWVDFDVYARGGLAILRGESLYDIRVDGLPFTYPPFAAWLFTLLSVVPIEVARWVFTAGSLTCYLAIVLVCARSTRIGWMHAAVVGAAGMTLEPFFTDIDLGQIDLYLILVVILDCLLVPARHRGWLVGLAAGIKIVPGAFVLYFLVKRDWPAVGRALAGFAVSVVVGALAAPTDSWRYWSGGFSDLSRFGGSVAFRADNQSISALFIRLSQDFDPPRVVLIGLSALALFVAALVAKRLLVAERPLDAVVALGLGSLLASPVSWTHHWLWVVPLLFVSVSRHWWRTSWTLGVVFLIGPIALFLPMIQFREPNQNWWQPILGASYVVFGIGILIRLLLSPSRRTIAATGAGIQAHEG